MDKKDEELFPLDDPYSWNGTSDETLDEFLAKVSSSSVSPVSRLNNITRWCSISHPWYRTMEQNLYAFERFRGKVSSLDSAQWLWIRVNRPSNPAGTGIPRDEIRVEALEKASEICEFDADSIFLLF